MSEFRHFKVFSRFIVVKTEDGDVRYPFRFSKNHHISLSGITGLWSVTIFYEGFQVDVFMEGQQEAIDLCFLINDSKLKNKGYMYECI